MNRNFISKIALLLVVALSAVQGVFAYTPLEAFINRVKQDNQFATVNNLWHPDKEANKMAVYAEVSKADLYTIDMQSLAAFMQQKNRGIELTIPTGDGNSFTVELARYDIFTNDFTTQVAGGGRTSDIGYTPGLYYRGIVNGVPGSIAAFSFFNNEIYGMFSIPGVGNYTIVPNNSSTQYILFNDIDIIHKDRAPKCATTDEDFTSFAQKTTATPPSYKTYYSCREVNVMYVCAYELYQKKSSNTTYCNNYMTALFNAHAAIYRNDGILIALKATLIDSTSDIYASITTASSTTSSTFLQAFGQTMGNNLGGANVAILLFNSTRVFQSAGFANGLGGVAWLRRVCTATQTGGQFAGPLAFCNITPPSGSSPGISIATPYVLPTYNWDIEVTSHEMGHVVGSPHTHACQWNPPTRNTGIDGCYAVYPSASAPQGQMEGSCAIPNPAQPVAGGTIMSYCHLVNIGINFANGFGPQPRDTIKNRLNSTTCNSAITIYNPDSAYRKASHVIKANRECTDLGGTTYYWYDNNTAAQKDDTLVLMIKKNGNNIGNLDSAGFDVRDSALVGLGTGASVNMAFPAGTPNTLASNYAVQHYWKMTPRTQPTSNVEVIFPITAKDSADVDGSFPGTVSVPQYYVYRLNSSTIDPAPRNFSSLTTSNFTTYAPGATATATTWSLTRVGPIRLMHFLTNLLTGGTAYANTNIIQSVTQTANNNITISVYPNPAHNQWTVVVPNEVKEDLSLQLFSTDGRMVHVQTMATGSNQVDISTLPTGVYFYRLVNSENLFTGNLIKQ